MSTAFDIQAKQIGAALAVMALATIGVTALGDLLLTRHEIHMVVAGLGIAAVAAVVSLFIPS